MSFTVVYLAGKSHSGTTLAGLLLGAHSQVFCIGEVKVISSKARTAPLEYARDTMCTCGASLTRCAFWSAVDGRLETATGTPLWKSELYGDDPAHFKERNKAFLSAVSEASGRPFLVDSSKDPERLDLLLRAGFDVRPVHVLRGPHGVVFSELRLGRDWAWHARDYTRQYRKIRATLAGNPHFLLRYEELASNPRAIISQLMDWLGLSFQESQLEWRASAQHLISGNLMRFEEAQPIAPDLAWRSGLSLAQKLRIGWSARSVLRAERGASGPRR